jgi:hypothetical protein
MLKGKVNMKRSLSILLSLAMLVTMLVGCDGSSSASSSPQVSNSGTALNDASASSDPSSREPIKIGVGYRVGIDIEAAKAFFDKLASQYNVEFVYSEIMQDIEAELAFVDNAASMGCQALMSWGLSNVEQVAAACASNNMYYVVHTQWNSSWDGSNPYWVGTCGFANPPKGEMYKEMLADFLEGKDVKGILIASGDAPSANLQHIETTVATLQALEEYYDLTFTDGDINELATLSAGTKLENDKGINIYILPGVKENEGYNTQLSTLLCTGEYDLFAAYQVDPNMINVISEAEEVIDSNIVVGGITVINDALVDIFNSKDRFGNCPIDRANIAYSSVTQAAMFAMVYNAVTGYGDIFRNDDDTCTGYGCAQVTVLDPANGAIFGALDNGDNPDSILATIEWTDTLIAERTPGFSKETWIENFVNVDCNALADAAIARIS